MTRKKEAKPRRGFASVKGGGEGGLVFFHFALHGVHLFFDGLHEGNLGAGAVQIVLRAVDFEVGVALQVVCEEAHAALHGEQLVREGEELFFQRGEEGRVAVEFNIKDDKDLFRSLLHKKDAIENASGLHFNWRELPEKTESRIIIEKNISFEDTEQKDKQFAWLVDSMLRMKKAFMAHI